MIEIYSKTICPYCSLAKQYLTDNGVPFQDVVFDDDTARATMYDELGLIGAERTVPQIFVLSETDRLRIGGYSELLQSGIVTQRQVVFDADF